MRDGLLSGAEALLEAAAQEQMQRQKLQAQLGGETAYRDCQALLSFYRHREEIDAFRRELPDVVKQAQIGQGTPITDLLTRNLTNAPNLAPWFFVEFLHRLEDSTALIMMLSEMAGDDSPETWENDPIATGLELVLFEIELLTARVHEQVADQSQNNGEQVGQYKALHQAPGALPHQ